MKRQAGDRSRTPNKKANEGVEENEDGQEWEKNERKRKLNLIKFRF